MFRRLLSGFLLILAVLAAVVFTWLNPGYISLDLGFVAVESPVSLAFVATFALGWLFGLASAGAWGLKRRRERKRRENAQQQSSDGASLPAVDGRR
ncbi:MAG: lipopolysaccharide assembly protein LapA domain-containing protein [Gammaproteobacteria bacterium]